MFQSAPQSQVHGHHTVGHRKTALGVSDLMRWHKVHLDETENVEQFTACRLEGAEDRVAEQVSFEWYRCSTHATIAAAVHRHPTL